MAHIIKDLKMHGCALSPSFCDLALLTASQEFFTKWECRRIGSAMSHVDDFITENFAAPSNYVKWTQATQ
jgi:hypothetical protein